MAGEGLRQSVRSAKGAEDFLRLSKAMKAAGQTELRKELHKAVRKAAKPAPPKVRAAARAKLPKKGGLGERIARRPVRIAVRTGAKTVGVRLEQKKTDPRLNNSGRVAHPVYGRRPLVVQQVPGAVGYFDQTIREMAPQMRADVDEVLRDFRKRLLAAAQGGGSLG